jgi:hypothetical protein
VVGFGPSSYVRYTVAGESLGMCQTAREPAIRSRMNRVGARCASATIAEPAIGINHTHTKGSISRRVGAIEKAVSSPEAECHFDDDRDVHALATQRSRHELPLARGFQRLLIQSERGIE